VPQNDVPRIRFSGRCRVILHGIPIFVASVEDVIVAKLEWSRLAQSHRQVEDVAAILRIRFDELNRGYAERWIESWT
jgi:hypothetical protein